MDSKHFVLVHGICHGAWCWFKLATLLKSAGHRVTALDLGSGGINSKRLDEVDSISDWLQPLMDFMASLPQEEQIILVGHSYGGIAISLAMESFPEKISVAVYVSAFMPNLVFPPATLVQEFFERTPKESLLDFHFSFDQGPENPPTWASLGPNYLAANLYQKCQVQDLELAKMLVKPSNSYLQDLAAESLLTEENFGSVSRVFILSEKDEMLKPDLQQWMIENGPPKEVKSLAGADHMAMLSKPNELSLCLQEIAEKYC